MLAFLALRFNVTGSAFYENPKHLSSRPYRTRTGLSRRTAFAIFFAMTTSDTPSIDAWVFDLDNTLYPASCRLFTQVDRRITEFIARTYDMESGAARALQKRFFREYGTTLAGLMAEGEVDPLAYLEFVHAIDVGVIAADPVLDALLERLPGRKFIFTNGSAAHAANVTNRLGIAHRFSGVYDIVAADFVPKPDRRPYLDMVGRFGIDPTRGLMVEDIARNLGPAKALGMRTVWLRSAGGFADPAPGDLDGVDHVADGLHGWLADYLAGSVEDRNPSREAGG